MEDKRVIEELRRALDKEWCVETVKYLISENVKPQAGVPAEPNHRQRVPPRRDGGCFTCGQVDHWRRDCPMNQGSTMQYQSREVEAKDDARDCRWLQSDRATSPGTEQTLSSYLELLTETGPIQCLVDSGAEKSVFPVDCVDECRVEDTRSTLRAANGTVIPVVGEAEIPVAVSGVKSKVRVSDQVPEPILGHDWLEREEAIVDFGGKWLVLRGNWCRLQSKPVSGCVRSVVVEWDVRVPPRCAYDGGTRAKCRVPTQAAGDAAPMWKKRKKGRDRTPAPEQRDCDAREDSRVDGTGKVAEEDAELEGTPDGGVVVPPPDQESSCGSTENVSLPLPKTPVRARNPPRKFKDYLM